MSESGESDNLTIFHRNDYRGNTGKTHLINVKYGKHPTCGTTGVIIISSDLRNFVFGCCEVMASRTRMAVNIMNTDQVPEKMIVTKKQAQSLPSIPSIIPNDMSANIFRYPNRYSLCQLSNRRG